MPGKEHFQRTVGKAFGMPSIEASDVITDLSCEDTEDETPLTEKELKMALQSLIQMLIERIPSTYNTRLLFNHSSTSLKLHILGEEGNRLAVFAFRYNPEGEVVNAELIEHQGEAVENRSIATYLVISSRYYPNQTVPVFDLTVPEDGIPAIIRWFEDEWKERFEVPLLS